MSIVRIFGVSVGVTVGVLVGALVLGGPEVFAVVAILGILEVSLSFDNAVVNATVLKRMSPFWQRMFLTIGILIAVFGMRLVFPLLIVAVTASLSPAEALDLALNDPDAYAREIESAHPAIAAFGGMFLAMIFLDFMFQYREHSWLAWIERPLARIGAVESLSTVVALATLLVASEALAGDASGTVLTAGVLGVVTYLVVNGFAAFFEEKGGLQGELADSQLAGIAGTSAAAGAAPRSTGPALAAGKAGFFLFIYLEVLDASFSFDGVLAAFAITTDIFVIAAGLGIGAFYIRSITVYLVRRGTLAEYVYLEHGAHYAIGALAVLLLASLRFEVPDVVTGLIGVGFIGWALVSSVRRNRRLATVAGGAESGAAGGAETIAP